MKKQLFLAFMALTSLGSLQATNPSLTDTASFVLKSGMRVAAITSEGIEDTITPTRIVVIAGALTFSATIVYVGDLMADFLTCRSLYDQRERERRRLQQLENERTALESSIQTQPNSEELQAQLTQSNQAIAKSRAKIAELTELLRTI